MLEERMLIALLLMVSSSLLPMSIASEVIPTNDNMLKAAEIKYELPEGLLLALAHVESNGNANAINKDDGNKLHKEQGLKIKSYGLLQIQLATARMIQRLMAKQQKFIINKHNTIKSNDLMKAEINIEYGAFYLKWLLQTYNDNVARSLSCFNAGTASYFCKNNKYNGDYVGKILNAWIKKREI